MFDPIQLKEQIEKTLNDGKVDIPDNHRVAAVTNFGPDGLHSAVAVKINNEWQVQGNLEFHPTIKKWDYGVSVRWSK